MIEVCVAVCCASVPAVKAVFSRSQRMRSRRAAGTMTAESRASESRSRSRLMSISGLARWHARPGSKDMSERSASGLGETDSGEVEAQMTVASPLPKATPLPEMQQAVVHETVRPGPRPLPFAPRQGSWLRGVDSTDTESMLVFTPLSPKTLANNGGTMFRGGMSSSGSTLILQR